MGVVCPVVSDRLHITSKRQPNNIMQMEFRTIIKTGENRGLITHNEPIMLMGSCFSDNIGQRMRTAMMNVDINPFGTIYNPLSIASSLKRLVEKRPVDGNDIFQAGGLWNSFLFHSRFSKSDKMRAIEGMNQRIESAHNHLKHARVLILTLGTAMVYRLRATNTVVSNCHKVPQHQFSRQMESIDGMTKALADAIASLRKFNPDLHIIVTVSPIRHIADGLAQNQLSKASLRVVADNLTKMMPQCVTYFPAYEIMLDDLRDYRFYAADMVHPSDVAIEYIWQTFQATFFDDRTSQAVSRCERVSKRLMHRPITDNRDAIARFNTDTRAVVANLVKEYPYLAENPTIKDVFMI